MLNIQPKYLSLNQLLTGRLFRIPEYQRSYSWRSQERQALFSDLDKLALTGTTQNHFLAAIVCLNKGNQTLGTDVFQNLDVVDGQQRLTTLILLLNALKRRLNSSDSSEARLQREIAELLVKVEGDHLLLLQTNHDSSHHFSKYLRKGALTNPNDGKTLADQQILLAIDECESYVDKWGGNTGRPLIDLGALLKNRLWFLVHEVSDEKTVYTVFEVLNSRGLEVAWLDRFKSILMGSIYDLKGVNHAALVNELHVIWRDIYKEIGLSIGLRTEVLRFAATLRAKSAPRRPLSEEDAVEALRAEATTASGITTIANWLLDVTKSCEEINSDKRISAVTTISQARLLATAIKARVDLKPAQKKMLLAQWEKMTFRIYGLLRNDARTRVGEYVRLAWSVTNESISGIEIAKRMKTIGDDFPIDDAVKQLRNQNCYEDWEDEFRYFMYRFEEHLAVSQNQKYENEQWTKIWAQNNSDSIEHIFPKSKAKPKIKHRLGNLVLLPPKLNSKLQAKAAVEKADDYIKTGLLIAGDVAARIKATGWTDAAMAKREDQLIEWAKKEWGE